jgi:hypothetical protein
MTGDGRAVDFCGSLRYFRFRDHRAVGLRTETGASTVTDDSRAERLLAGERILWTGRPGSARASLGDAAFAVYLIVACTVVVVVARKDLQGAPVPFRAFAVFVLAAGTVQALGILVYLLAIKPRVVGGTVYRVTDYRVIVVTGLRVRRAWSAYLDQLDEPVLRPGGDGTESLLLRPQPRRWTRGFRSGTAGGPFSLLGASDVPVLRSLSDGTSAREIIATARRQLIDGGAQPVQPPPEVPSPALPDGVDLAGEERALWVGRPVRPPWWFGPPDVYLSAFAVFWLAGAILMCVLVVSSDSGFLVVLVPLAIFGGVYPAFGRVVHRRLRILRSTYVVTSRRLILTWRMPLGQPVTVQAGLIQLLPPGVEGQTIVARWSPADEPERSAGWKGMSWPVSTSGPPALIGIGEAERVRDLIATAQLALRARERQRPA